MIKESLKKSTNMMVTRLPAAPILTMQRSFTGNTRVLDDKEKGDELIYFKKQESNTNYA